MKPQELKKEFVRLRAEGKSYSAIAKDLKISKSTCVSWEKELDAQIDDMKRASLEELCEEYGMAKEARIKRIGNTLDNIQSAIDAADLQTIDADKLLGLQLKYMEALKDEYTGIRPNMTKGASNPESVKAAMENLLNRVQRGDATQEQAKTELMVLSHILRAYEATTLKERLDRLDTIIGGRPDWYGESETDTF